MEFGLIGVGELSSIFKTHERTDLSADCSASNKFVEEANAILRNNNWTQAAALKVDVERVSDEKSKQRCPSLQISALLLKENSSTGSEAILAGLKESIVSAPCAAVQQALGLEVSYKAQQSNDKGQKTAQVVGALVPLVGVVALTRGVGNLVLSEGLSPLHRVIYEQASAGFIVGSFLTPTELKPGESLWSKRIEQGSKAAATYATMTGTSASLENSIPDFGEGTVSRLARKISITVVSGTVAGYLDPLGESNFRGTGVNSISSTLLFSKFEKVDDRWSKLNPERRIQGI